MGRNLSVASVVADPPCAANTRDLVPFHRQQALKPIQVLTLTPFYPSAEDDARGCFVAEALPALTERAVRNEVIAIQPFYRRRITPCDTAPAKWVRYFSLAGNAGLSSAGRFLSSRIISDVDRLRRAHKLDLIHAHAALPCGHAAALIGQKLGIPYVVTVHGLDAYSVNQAGRFAGRACRRVSEEVYARAARVICISEKVCEQLGRGVNASVIYNGVDPSIFAAGDREGGAPFKLLSVGNLIPIKGHELLLRAIALAKKRWLPVECDIIGEGPLRASLQSLAGRLGISEHVRFLGRQNRRQVADAMRRCGIFALTSRYEGLGCVYLEAMAAAKPVIACRGQGIAEIIQHGINGWLVSTDDVEELEAALLGLLHNPQLRRALGSAARDTILANFTLAHQAEGLAQVYRECVA